MLHSFLVTRENTYCTITVYVVSGRIADDSASLGSGMLAVLVATYVGRYFVFFKYVP